MRLFLATSCLQGRPLQESCEALLELPVAGIQLCAGNAPTAGFEAWRSTRNRPFRTHHGFTTRALRTRVWTGTHQLAGTWDSVHPPRTAEPDWLPSSLPDGVCLEVMYGDQPLGSSTTLERAMERGLPLAVDVSHVYIQLCQGSMTRATWARLQEYHRIEEIHVSANDGRRDRHSSIEPRTFGLEWVRERAGNDLPVVVESYWHRVNRSERLRQLDLLIG